jgi:hypothetical protein
MLTPAVWMKPSVLKHSALLYQPSQAQPEFAQVQFAQPQFAQPQFAQPQFESNAKKTSRSRTLMTALKVGLALLAGVGIIYSIKEGSEKAQQNAVATADGYYRSDAYIHNDGKIYSSSGVYKGRYTPDGKMYKGLLERYNGYVTPEGKIYRTVFGRDTDWGEVQEDGTIVNYMGTHLGKVPGDFSLQEKGQIGYLAFTQ